MPSPPPADTAAVPEPALALEEERPADDADAHSVRAVVRTWWPLAASWVLMGAELPAISAVVARLADFKVHLAAWGGVVFPLALLVEAPIIMMLAASTALSRDADSYRKLLRFTTLAGLSLTAVHGLVAFTPLYDIFVVGVIQPPPEVVEPGRLGLRLMTPWTWAIADRRFHQGVLIRFGYSRAVGLGTGVRLLTSGGVLAVGLWTEALPGIALGASAVTLGVLVEMGFARMMAAPVVRGALSAAPPGEPLTPRSLLAFYVPLALTPLFVLAMQPIGGAAMSRLALPLECLATWPALNGLIFVLRSTGLAYNEVAVRHAGDARAHRALVRFAWILALVTGGLMLVFATTPLARFWFGDVMGLGPRLTELAVDTVLLGLFLPPLGVVQSLYQGHLTHARRTRAVTEACAIFMVISCAGLGLGILLQLWNGLQVALVSFTVGMTAQSVWLYLRARPLLPGR